MFEVDIPTIGKVNTINNIRLPAEVNFTEKYERLSNQKHNYVLLLDPLKRSFENIRLEGIEFLQY